MYKHSFCVFWCAWLYDIYIWNFVNLSLLVKKLRTFISTNFQLDFARCGLYMHRLLHAFRFFWHWRICMKPVISKCLCLQCELQYIIDLKKNNRNCRTSDVLGFFRPSNNSYSDVIIIIMVMYREKNYQINQAPI